MTDALRTVRDFIRYAVSRAGAAGVVQGQGFDSALDEACFLVLRSLHLPHDLPPAYAGAALLDDERTLLLDRIERRVTERVPAAYLVGEAWFCGLSFAVGEGVLIPRSPIAELIEQGFEPWLDGQAPARILDLCTGSGCIGIACAMQFTDAEVDLIDLSPAALGFASRNLGQYELAGRVRALQGDLFGPLTGQQYDLIVSNPPYVADAEVDALPQEFSHEPALALRSGADGLDLPLRILAAAADHLQPEGWLVLEVGGAAASLHEALPAIEADWPEFERGGDGVLVLSAAAVAAIAPAAQQLCRQRQLEI
ncbi:MAG: 50S ribosomal protein L3 N(5)-glutamine methyltransferase [Xanthomonadales bacterium]|nr:50S ribosomal protein L3 N(5)-glutamine methyltransferase [Xanthomonadales bacterium]